MSAPFAGSAVPGTQLPGSVPESQDAAAASQECGLGEELAKLEICEWEAVREAFKKCEAAEDDALESLIADSAEKLGFWRPEKELLVACRKALSTRLSEKVRDPAFSQVENTAPTVTVASVRETAKSPAGGAPAAPQTDPEKDMSPHAASGLLGGASPKSRSGSKVIGFMRQISERKVSVSGMLRQMSDKTADSTVSAIGLSKRDARSATNQTTATAASAHLMKGGSLFLTKSSQDSLKMDGALSTSAKEIVAKESLLNSNPAKSYLKTFKVALFVFILFQMILFGLYVVFYMTPETWDTIGLPILIARGSAYGACFWTAVLFLTMSRDLISFVVRIRCVRDSQWAMQFLNSYKELHIFSAYEVLLDGMLHALMHHIGTFVALEKYSGKELNQVFVCSKEKDDIPDGYLGKAIVNFLKPFQWPSCPFPEDADVGYFDGVLSTPGITGYLLMIVICALGWFSRRKSRKANFRLFYVLHHLLVPAWVLLLILHGANDWVGLGFPLVILVAGIPLATYGWTRIRRSYLSYCCGAEVVSATKSHTGKLLRLEIEVPRGYYKCKVGQYAYINIPEIGWSEWHPFTISSSLQLENGRQKVIFCIMGVGVWTKKLMTLFADDTARPKISIDGPHYAPTVSMPQRSTVVGIGAGVGVTPFLSFLGGLAENKGGGYKNAHVFWMSAFATDFVLFNDLLSEVDSLTASGGCRTTFHLHATPRFGAWDGKGLGCLFELLCRDVWHDWVARCSAKDADRAPIFSNYPKPIHGIVSKAVLQSKKPLAVAMGSPDFNAELLAIGDEDESEDVFVYFCGNPFLQNMVQVACASCNELRKMQDKQQRFYFYFERFG